MIRSPTPVVSSLLLTLEEISQLVSHSHDPTETLANIVQLIQERFQTDVCSVYVHDPERRELILRATVGLRPESVGQVRMGIDEGLTGLVAQTLSPVTVEDAFKHPRFKYFPEAGEDPYHSFLGVPLVEGGVLQGVLVVQTGEPRSFLPDEVRMLVTVGAQLAPLVGGAQLLEQLVHDTRPASASATGETHVSILQGRSLSPGTGCGRAYLLDDLGSVALPNTPSQGAVVEKARLQRAIEAAHAEIVQLSQRISDLVGEHHGAILQAQLMLLQDRTVEHDLAGCLANGDSAEAALSRTLDKYVAVFQKLTNALLQERVYDLKDVFQRVLWHLNPPTADVDAGEEPRVVIAREASVMDLFSVDPERLAGVVVEHGGPQSHAAILARSLRVPMVGQVAGLLDRVRPGSVIAVDGTAGTVNLEPPTMIRVRAHRETPAAADQAPAALPPGLPRVEANVNLLGELPAALRDGAAGVGLYRSEFLFLARRTLPTEEEQVEAYSHLLRGMAGRPVTIRTFDLRPDKAPRSARLRSAGDLDWRRVLESPPMQQLFKEQVRAIFRAAAIGPARLLVPFVTCSEHIDLISRTVTAARAELRTEGLAFDAKVSISIMIEVAAAAVMADAWAKHVDAFALGTNDLSASALGIDRDDPSDPGMGDPLHPALLRLIHRVVQTGRRANRPVTVCGEMAADPDGAIALAALGVDALSVPVPQLRAIRQVLSGLCPAALRSCGARLLRCATAQAARQILHAPRRPTS